MKTQYDHLHVKIEVDLVIPSNDDAIRAIKLFSSKVADATIEGAQKREEALKEQAEKKQAEKKQAEEGGIYSKNGLFKKNTKPAGLRSTPIRWSDESPCHLRSESVRF